MKPKMLAVAKSEYHCYYEFEKKQGFFAAFRNVLNELGINDERWQMLGFGRPIDEHGEPDLSREVKVAGCTDQHFYFSGPGISVDVVFGKARIFVMIATKKDMQQRISKALQKNFSAIGNK